jgi:hypothetical protein
MGVARGLLAAVGAVAVVLLGCWLTGGVLTDDATTAMALTGLWFAVAVGSALAALRRWRRPALPAAAAALVTVVAVGSWLLLTSRVDRVVDEQVLAELTTATASPSGSAPAAVTRLAAGAFTSGAHETTGKATLLRGPNGRLVLTLVGFRTAAGPDLRVRIVAAGSQGVDGGKDLGALKGNKGNQQYAVPAGAPTGRVVIWCRAFSVVFGSADLQR